MDTKTKISCMLLGAVSGGLLGYMTFEIVAWKLLEESQEQEEGEPIYSDNVRVQDYVVADEKPDLETIIGVPVPIVKDYDELIAEDESLHDYTQYGSEMDESLIEEEEWEEDENQEIRIIGIGEWEELQSRYQKVPVTYFQKDGIFSAPDGTEVRDTDELFPPNIQLHFGSESGDPDLVYVRNPRTGSDYEISRFDGSYAEIILGEPVEEGKLEEKPVQRRARPADES